MRTCFLHIGTHKTGTTSLQVALGRSGTDLRDRDYLYPLSGRPDAAPSGHHNLAWEISGDRRFRMEFGTLKDVLNEAEGGPSHLILSSEDFECSLHHTARFHQFVQQLRAVGFRVRIVIYLRNHADYLQSLYLEMLKHGIHHTFREFLDEVLSSGRFHWQEWIFAFSYGELLVLLQAVEGVDIVVRSFDRVRNGSLCSDFLTILGLDPRVVTLETLPMNAREDLISSLSLFCVNRRRAPLTRLQERILHSLFEPLRGRPVEISNENRLRIAERFTDFGSDTLFGGDVAAYLDSKPARRASGLPEALSMETLFSSDLEHQINALSDAFRAELEAMRGA